VIYGVLLLLVYLAINTIWLSLMITPILCGLFLYVLNLTLFLLCQIFSLMTPHSFAAPSKPSSATMVMSSITPPLTHSSSLKGYFYGCLISTLLRRMVKPSASFALSIICCVPSFFRLLFQLATDRRAPHRHISAELPPNQGDQHDQPILHPQWNRPLL
jgi:hypothetical protein